MQKYLWIAAGGALGAIARYVIGAAVGSRMGIKFPYGTLIINISACVIIGFTITIEKPKPGLSCRKEKVISATFHK